MLKIVKEFGMLALGSAGANQMPNSLIHTREFCFGEKIFGNPKVFGDWNWGVSLPSGRQGKPGTHSRVVGNSHPTTPQVIIRSERKSK